MLEANHKMWIFGVKFLEIDYEIKKIGEVKKLERFQAFLRMGNCHSDLFI